MQAGGKVAEHEANGPGGRLEAAGILGSETQPFFFELSISTTGLRGLTATNHSLRNAPRRKFLIEGVGVLILDLRLSMFHVAQELQYRCMRLRRDPSFILPECDNYIAPSSSRKKSSPCATGGPIAVLNLEAIAPGTIPAGSAAGEK